MLEAPPSDRFHHSSSFAMPLIVGGSHLGMILLCGFYAIIGSRAELVVGPEAVAIAIGFSYFIISKGLRIPKVSIPTLFLYLFCVTGILGDFLRTGGFQLSSINVFVSIILVSIVGFGVGQDLFQQKCELPYMPQLLLIYVCWYTGLLLFLAIGELGFHGVLPGTNLLRLEFRSSFAATEIPIYVGFHLPVLIYCSRSAPSTLLRRIALVLIGLSLLLSACSVSVAVAMAISIVFAIFAMAKYGVFSTRMFVVTASLVMLVAFVLIASSSLRETVMEKIWQIIEGEGARGQSYQELIRIMETEPMGIGLRQFQFRNEFSWQKEGIYPHSNFLGIGAELGVVSLLFYCGFVVLALASLVSGAFSRNAEDFPYHVRMVVVAALSVFLFQQFRGLLQDTWAFRELYLWVSLGLGICSARSSQRFAGLEC